ncbi:MAG: serine hydroxymethyltransferase [Patescibacteria group bacterium]
MKDTKINTLMQKEWKRQKEGVELIPSENYVSMAVRKALSSYFVNKYSEGYPKKRYYGGNEYVDEIEVIAQDRAKKLFNVPYVNVQPYSGSPANLAVYLAVCKPSEVVLGQALTAGGHLTHGHFVSATGIYYTAYQYGLKTNITGETTDLFDYEEIKAQVKKYRPKLMWIGATAYPLQINYKRFAEIADEFGVYLAADIAHIAGLIVGGVHPSPVPFVHIVTTTTHKTLRGPRGAMIMVTEKGLQKDPELAKKINRAVFPGLQGGPHDNQTAAIAVSLHEASQESFKTYAKQIISNAKALATCLTKGGWDLVGGGSQNHLLLADLRKTIGSGAGIFMQKALDLVGLTVNKNTIPGETSSSFYPSGIRLGTPAATTRGMKEKEMMIIGNIILNVADIVGSIDLPATVDERIKVIEKFEFLNRNSKKMQSLRREVKTLALRFPIP